MKNLHIRSFSGPYFPAFGPENLWIRTLFTQCLQFTFWHTIKRLFPNNGKSFKKIALQDKLINSLIHQEKNTVLENHSLQKDNAWKQSNRGAFFYHMGWQTPLNFWNNVPKAPSKRTYLSYVSGPSFNQRNCLTNVFFVQIQKLVQNIKCLR